MRPGSSTPAGSKLALMPRGELHQRLGQRLEHVDRGAHRVRRAHQRRMAARRPCEPHARMRRAGVTLGSASEPDQAAAPIVKPARRKLRRRAPRSSAGALRRRDRDAPDRGVARGRRGRSTSRTSRQSSSLASRIERRRPCRNRAAASASAFDPVARPTLAKPSSRSSVRALRLADAGGQMRRARHLEGRAERRRRAPRWRARRTSPSMTSVASRLRHRQHLEGDLGEEAERAEGAGHELHEIEPGDVLHHPAAGLDHLAAAVDEAHADQANRGGAGLDAARAGDIAGRDAADRRLARACREAAR